MKVGLVSAEDPMISEFEMDGVFGLGTHCRCFSILIPTCSYLDRYSFYMILGFEGLGQITKPAFYKHIG